MAEYQIMRWREIPSMVIARDGDLVVKIGLPPRFQEAIDEAAMRLGEADADAYLSGWNRDPWIASEGTPKDVADLITANLEESFSEDRLAELLDALEKK